MGSSFNGGEMMPSDFEVLSQCFSYEPDTGILRWKIHLGKGHPGMEAGFPAGEPDAKGVRYLEVRVRGRTYKLHRVIWLLMTGSFPEKGMEVDHINGNRIDNRWDNFRLATKTQNMRNRGRSRNNTSGVHGVGFSKSYGKWQARIMVDHNAIHLGYFDTIEEAAAARKAGEEKYFGEFARKAA